MLDKETTDEITELTKQLHEILAPVLRLDVVMARS
jgi:hypothetical protein